MALGISEEDLIDNPTPRVPVSLCIDTSSSMTGDKIRELVEGIGGFTAAIRDDEDARDAAEVSVVEFNSSATLIQDFVGVDRFEIVNPQPMGTTHLGEGVNLALDTLEARKQQYSSNGVLYYQPWLVLMTDGQPNGSSVELDRAIRRTVDLVAEKKITVFPIGIGADADMAVLAKFSPTRPPLRLKGLNFAEFFEWLSKSVARVSRSTPGDAIKLDLEGLAGWAEL